MTCQIARGGWLTSTGAIGSAVDLVDLGVGQARDNLKAQVASILRQTDTGRAGFIASSKNKTWKQTIVLSESDVDLSCASGAPSLADWQWRSAD